MSITTLLGRPPHAPASEQATGNITVARGHHEPQVYPLAGSTVNEIREFLASILDIQPSDRPYVGGKTVPGNQVVKTGEALEFITEAAENG